MVFPQAVCPGGSARREGLPDEGGGADRSEWPPSLALLTTLMPRLKSFLIPSLR